MDVFRTKAEILLKAIISSRFPFAFKIERVILGFFFSSQNQNRLHSIQLIHDVVTVNLFTKDMSTHPFHGNASRQLLSIATMHAITKQTQICKQTGDD